jgi:hypothetical protein
MRVGDAAACFAIVVADADGSRVGRRGRTRNDWQLRNGRYNSSAKPPWSGRIVAALGPEVFGAVRWANIRPLGGDATMYYVEGIGGLQTLNVSAPLTHTGLARVRGLSSRKRLIVDRSWVTAAGLVYRATPPLRAAP